jgi:hypothetical protein
MRKFAVGFAWLAACAPQNPSSTPSGTPPGTPAPRPPPVSALAPPENPVDAASVEDAGPASRDASTTSRQQQKLELAWQNAWNLHYGGQAGAEHENSRGRVTIELAAGGQSTAVDSGKRVESVLDGTRYTETTTEWRTTWRGTHTFAGGGLRLDLGRESDSCEVTESERDGAVQYQPEKSGCSGGAAHLALECQPASVDATPSLDDLDAKATPTPVWICQTAHAAKDAKGTPQPWVFGKEHCLEHTGGGPRSGPIRYGLCKP